MPFARDEWAHLREATPLTLSEEDLERLRGLNDPVSVKEVVEIYLPLSRLLNLHVAATQELHASTTQFLGTTEAAAAVRHRHRRQRRRRQEHDRAPAAGAARPLAGSPARRSGDDRWLPAAERGCSKERGLMKRKGFPESYDVRRLVQFVADVKAGAARRAGPVYSHTRYDIVDGRMARRAPARHPDRRGAQRAADGSAAAAGVRSGRSCRTSSTSRSTSTRTRATSNAGTSSAS